MTNPKQPKDHATYVNERVVIKDSPEMEEVGRYIVEAQRRLMVAFNNNDREIVATMVRLESKCKTLITKSFIPRSEVEKVIEEIVIDTDRTANDLVLEDRSPIYLLLQGYDLARNYIIPKLTSLLKE